MVVAVVVVAAKLRTMREVVVVVAPAAAETVEEVEGEKEVVQQLEDIAYRQREEADLRI